MKNNFFLISLFIPFFSFSEDSIMKKKEYDQKIHFLKPVDNVIPEITTDWMKQLKIIGYFQFRYNELYNTNTELQAEQSDASLGKNKGFFLRRARIKISAQLNDYVYFQIQPDFGAGSASLRDAYIDLSLDKENEYRFRLGQSKVPYSFENMQSSQNRLSLDRNEALNSAFRDERDLGVFFFWTPKEVQNRYSFLVKSGLKGSGNYGVFAFGVFNGQRANQIDLNPNKHFVARLNYPFKLENNQILEIGINGYKGKHVISNINNGVLLNNGIISYGKEDYKSKEFTDERLGASIVFYPQPIGFQAEYNFGKGPEFDPDTKSIQTKKLHGGYAMIMSRFSMNSNHIFFPFIKYQFYNGGKKHEIDARSYVIKDLEIGLEWQPFPFFELNTTFLISDRKYMDLNNLDRHHKGNILRIQAQLNF